MRGASAAPTTREAGRGASQIQVFRISELLGVTVSGAEQGKDRPDRQADGAGYAHGQDDAESPKGLAQRRLVPNRGNAMRGVPKRS